MDLQSETLDCPDHGEQIAEHYRLYQFTDRYRAEMEAATSKKDVASEDATITRISTPDSRDLEDSPETRAIREQTTRIEAMHETIRRWQQTAAPEGPVARTAMKIALAAVIVAIVVGVPTLYFTAYPVIRD